MICSFNNYDRVDWPWEDWSVRSLYSDMCKVVQWMLIAKDFIYFIHKHCSYTPDYIYNEKHYICLYVFLFFYVCFINIYIFIPAHIYNKQHTSILTLLFVGILTPMSNCDAASLINYNVCLQKMSISSNFFTMHKVATKHFFKNL